MGGMPGGMPPEQGPSTENPYIPRDVLQNALSMLRNPQEALAQAGAAGGASPFGEASNPINLLNSRGAPPTPRGIPAPQTSNPRGMNRGGKVNTNVASNKKTSTESNLLNRAASIQR